MTDANPDPDRRLERHRELVARLSRELVLREGAAQQQIARLREQNRRLEGKLDRRAARLRERRARIASLEDEIEKLRASETWRVGSALLWVPRRLGRRVRRR